MKNSFSCNCMWVFFWHRYARELLSVCQSHRRSGESLAHLETTRKTDSPRPVPISCPCVPPFKNRAQSSHGGDSGSSGSIRLKSAVYLPRFSLQALGEVQLFPVTPRGENPLLPEGTASSYHSGICATGPKSTTGQ